MLRSNVKKGDRKREIIDGVRESWSDSVRRACRVVKFDTSTCQDKSRRRDPASLKARIKEICETRVFYGYRRMHCVL